MLMSDYTDMFVGSAEAAELLGVGPTNFSHMRRKMEEAGDENFPALAMKFRMGPAWLKEDMLRFKEYYDSHRRRGPKPKVRSVSEHPTQRPQDDDLTYLVTLAKLREDVAILDAKIAQAILEHRGKD